jgi:hypothetical protein
VRNLLRASLGVLLVLIVTDAWAVTLYKLTDRAGRTTYADVVPRGFEGTVSPIAIDTSEHVVTLPGPAPDRPAMRTPAENERIILRRPDTTREDRLAAARAKVEVARAALESAQAGSTADDWIYFGPNNPNGMRRAPRPEFQARLARLEAEVQAAESQLREAERG